MGFTQAQKLIAIIDTTEGSGRSHRCSQKDQGSPMGAPREHWSPGSIESLEVVSQSLPEDSSLLSTVSVCENDLHKGRVCPLLPGLETSPPSGKDPAGQSPCLS